MRTRTLRCADAYSIIPTGQSLSSIEILTWPDHLHDMKTRGLNSCSRKTGTQLSTCIDVLVEVRRL